MKRKKFCATAAIVLVFLMVLSTAVLAVNTNQNKKLSVSALCVSQ